MLGYLWYYWLEHLWRRRGRRLHGRHTYLRHPLAHAIQSSKTLEHYLQVVTAASSLISLKPSARTYISTLCDLYDVVLVSIRSTPCGNFDIAVLRPWFFRAILVTPAFLSEVDSFCLHPPLQPCVLVAFGKPNRFALLWIWLSVLTSSGILSF